MDPMGIAGMVFVLLIILFVGGFTLLFPISRRLGAYLEQRLNEGRGDASLPGRELTELRQQLVAIQEEVERIAERQEFTDRLLSGSGDAGRIGGSASAGIQEG